MTRQTFDCPPDAAARDCHGCPIFQACIKDLQEWVRETEEARAARSEA